MVSRQKAGRIGGITRVGPVAWLLAALLAFASPSYAAVCLMRGCTVNTFGGKTSCNKIRSSTQLRTSCSTPTRPCCRYDSAPAKVAPANRSLRPAITSLCPPDLKSKTLSGCARKPLLPPRHRPTRIPQKSDSEPRIALRFQIKGELP